MISRRDRSLIAEWWWTVDRTTLFLVLLLLAAGVVLSFAASPPVAERIGLSPYHFALRQAMYAPTATAIILSISLLTPRQVRRLALLILLVSLSMMVAVLFIGDEVKGSRRWVYIGGMSLQPSEFLKPAFIVIVAWLFAEGSKHPEVPGKLLAVILLIITAALLVAEPDLGQTILVFSVWGAVFFLAGVSLPLVGGLAGTAVAGLFAAYFMFPHFTSRIDRFLNPEGGDTYQVDIAMRSFERGGWSGSGPGEGVMKRILPDSHTDFVFAVIAEEFGIILCLALICIFGFIVMRGLMHALRRKQPFERMAIAGLSTQIGLQAFINMGVNLQLLPAKGMTLPFISYGGSALLSSAVVMGFILALSRERAERKVTVMPHSSFAEQL
ncbi:putative lipid II flippase FtsW [Afifella marina]|uniref:Probable peptidoglycan glycosyltransferase FtsW n=1 Tax=Afifella marina DSM 2698 TaxID=1120955 RepID=A0A1G5N3B9_AFIMA|nr:putative lipid II flippase FtsW [Afifella marina]MBK1622409.1 putative lipid II flippase FtsW [Afifella marina DSM 2698]MBK1626877.1 putative lipid II flippase FtsW [Afifella marina]MBK5919193.1 putative lipid II flippase FtsW [Afifella marina]RAI21239.1 putative lipid II flippase FtsW [Afifella marina DSM 2698]SCZ31927.1 cell division protein FtsW [Afifella marina DSM 2698]